MAFVVAVLAGMLGGCAELEGLRGAAQGAGELAQAITNLQSQVEDQAPAAGTVQDRIPAFAGGAYADAANHGTPVEIRYHEARWLQYPDGWCANTDIRETDSFPKNFNERAILGFSAMLYDAGGRSAENQLVTQVVTRVLSTAQYDEPAGSAQPDKIEISMHCSGGFRFWFVYSHHGDAPASPGQADCGWFTDGEKTVQGRINKTVIYTGKTGPYAGKRYWCSVRKRFSRDADANDLGPARTLPR
jgi:hypothetical protein